MREGNKTLIQDDINQNNIFIKILISSITKHTLISYEDFMFGSNNKMFIYMIFLAFLKLKDSRFC